MDDGLIVTLPELIGLKKFVRTKNAIGPSIASRMGQRKSRLRGRGMDFAEVRNYQAGDEIRHMEWRSTARTGRPHIKLYEEERERPVMLLVDFNKSMYFGTRKAFKSVVAARLAALLTWIAIAEGDRVGSVLFSHESANESLPIHHQKKILPLFANLSRYTAMINTTFDTTNKPIADGLIRVKRLLKPGSLLIIISDFYTFNGDAIAWLSHLKQHHDVIAYHIADPLELAAPEKPGHYPVSQGQTTCYLDLSNAKKQRAFTNVLEERIQKLKNDFVQLNVPLFLVTAEMDWITLAHQSFPRKRHV